MLIFLDGEVPSKKNNRITLRSGKTVPSVGYQQWHNWAMVQFYRSYRDIVNEPLDMPLRVNLTFYHGNLTKRDSDNQATSVLDFLKDVKVIADDNWQIIRELNIKNAYRAKHAYVLIEILPLENGTC